MKNAFFLLTIAVAFAACEEKPILIPALQVGERKVLVEEVTGVNCQQCPDGTAELQSLVPTLGEKLIVVAFHNAGGTFSIPHSNSRYDFRTPDGAAIVEYNTVAALQGAPMATIDRQIVPNEKELFFFRPWKGQINARAAVAPNIGLFVSNTFNAATRELSITANVSPDEPLTGSLRLSVYITEDSVIDAQLKDLTLLSDYVHRHVFRDAVTAPTGDDVTALLANNEPFSKTYTVTLPPEWDTKHCSVVAFVHRHGNPENRQVLQAEEQHVKL
jgi:hypothetical protein